jgi:hypothetical protein
MNEQLDEIMGFLSNDPEATLQMVHNIQELLEDNHELLTSAIDLAENAISPVIRRVRDAQLNNIAHTYKFFLEDAATKDVALALTALANAQQVSAVNSIQKAIDLNKDAGELLG